MNQKSEAGELTARQDTDRIQNCNGTGHKDNPYLPKWYRASEGSQAAKEDTTSNNGKRMMERRMRNGATGDDRRSPQEFVFYRKLCTEKDASQRQVSWFFGERIVHRPHHPSLRYSSYYLDTKKTYPKSDEGVRPERVASCYHQHKSEVRPKPVPSTVVSNKSNSTDKSQRQRPDPTAPSLCASVFWWASRASILSPQGGVFTKDGTGIINKPHFF